ncbi:HEPN domain-containing protein [Methylobacterium sp. Leaf112]|uniref:HEPN domain-containing protein n=1 Tax=Methylobacterium sp. Leaf112 TaxID=1736258 RepID=UPI0012E98353|nr:HEPN domain-containing protein [Methylobacterium sp. Leaf112]
MKRQELQAEFDRLKFQIAIIKAGSGKDRDELISLSSQQICVSICGSLEQLLKRIFIEYAKQRSNSRIYRPIEKICESYQNPKTTKILELVGLFDSAFEAELKRQWDNELDAEKQHLDNMVDDRITIAHRKKVHVDVSSSKLQNYFNAYSGLLDRVYTHFLGPA